MFRPALTVGLSLASPLGAAASNWLGRSQFTADPAFDGQIDDLCIYNSALSATQITAIYNVR